MLFEMWLFINAWAVDKRENIYLSVLHIVHMIYKWVWSQALTLLAELSIKYHSPEKTPAIINE